MAVFKASTSNVLEPWVRVNDSRVEQCSVLALEPEGQLTSPGGQGWHLQEVKSKLDLEV